MLCPPPHHRPAGDRHASLPLEETQSAQSRRPRPIGAERASAVAGCGKTGEVTEAIDGGPPQEKADIEELQKYQSTC